MSADFQLIAIAGGFISTIASATGVAIRSSGREVT